MPIVTFQDIKMECMVGANLRKMLVKNGIGPYNGSAKMINCHGLGTCGTCAVEVLGDVSEMTQREQLRLSFPPHEGSTGLRLACQCSVLGDVTVRKHEGFWGQKLGQADQKRAGAPSRQSPFSR
jgi:ferredoxin